MFDPSILDSFQYRVERIRKIRPEDLVLEKNRGRLTVMDVKPNGFFELEGRHYSVSEICTYEETSEDYARKLDYTVTEMVCLEMETGKTVHVEFEFDDELEVTVSMERISFSDLADEAGEAVDSDDLDQIVGDQDLLVFGSEKFWYEDDWAAVYNCREKAEKVMMYEFENESGTKYLTVEEWEPDTKKPEYRIFLSRPVSLSKIRIITRGAQ